MIGNDYPSETVTSAGINTNFITDVFIKGAGMPRLRQTDL